MPVCSVCITPARVFSSIALSKLHANLGKSSSKSFAALNGRSQHFFQIRSDEHLSGMTDQLVSSGILRSVILLRTLLLLFRLESWRHRLSHETTPNTWYGIVPGWKRKLKHTSHFFLAKSMIDLDGNVASERVRAQYYSSTFTF